MKITTKNYAIIYLFNKKPNI